MSVVDDIDKEVAQSRKSAIETIENLSRNGVNIADLDIADANDLVSSLSGEAAANTIGVVSAMRSILLLKGGKA